MVYVLVVTMMIQGLIHTVDTQIIFQSSEGCQHMADTLNDLPVENQFFFCAAINEV